MQTQKTVLIIEDDDILQRMYKQKLESSGITAVAVKDGNEGLDYCRANKPNLVLLDIMLSEGVNGFDILEQLKRDPKTQEIPVVVLTILDSEKKVAFDIGAADYIVKSDTRPEQVIKRIQDILSKNKK